MWWRATWEGPSPTCSHQPRGSTRARQPARTSPTASHIRKLKRWLDKKSSQFKLKTHLLLFKLRVQIHPTETAQFFNKLPQPNELKPETQDNVFIRQQQHLLYKYLGINSSTIKNITSTQPLTFFRTAKADNRRKLALLQWWRAWANRVLLSYNKP